MARGQIPDPRADYICEACNRTFTTARRSPSRGPARYCSLFCRDYAQHGGNWTCELPTRHPARPQQVNTRTVARTTRMQARFTNGQCADCGTWFTASTHGSPIEYCSRSCQRRVAKRARRAREHNAPGHYRYTEVMRLYLLGNKVCAYCDQPIDGLPEPEHVVPLSRGGRNDLTNLLPACRPCNTDKQDMTPAEWAFDRRRRGREPRRYKFPIHEARFRHLVVGLPTPHPRSLRSMG